MSNLQVQLVRYPEGTPAPEDFALVDAPMPAARPGELLLQVEWLGLDPFPRLRMRSDSRVGPPMPLGAVVDGRGLATVVGSDDAAFPLGTLVAAETGWQQFTALPAAKVQRLPDYAGPASHHLSTLGPSGLTAFFTAELAAVLPGQVLVIAPAAGSVGVVAGQLARAAGARVIGLAASAAQCDFLRQSLGFEAATTDPAELATLAPDGVHGFIDGVGGALHDVVAAHLALQARVVLLGFIAAYNDAAPPRYGSALPILFKRARVQGFLLADHMHDAPRALQRLAAALADGSLRAVETIHQGLAATPAAFAGLFADPAPGKQIVRLDHQES
ncbi:hypothetical protein FHS79_002104 [Polymorphobacter multimanifer]|uniref:NADP-dependent oxidoreductase n=1 Tax=Polymorphobacter multimanifer TaxID=1070431 RepID=A0A841LAD5_9SPHN|nr:NADP-dependent oxidoreductase [Polymorphobacter multimanifer]MBB6227923.1 hypothetical protein [Polymorphobacter multimanifer]